MNESLKKEVFKKINESFELLKIEKNEEKVKILDLIELYNRSFDGFYRDCDLECEDLVNIMEILKENRADPDYLSLRACELYFKTKKKMIDLRKIDKEGRDLRGNLKKLEEIEIIFTEEVGKLEEEQNNYSENIKENKQYQEDFFIKKIEGERKKVQGYEEINWEDIGYILNDEDFMVLMF